MLTNTDELFIFSMLLLTSFSCTVLFSKVDQLENRTIELHNRVNYLENKLIN